MTITPYGEKGCCRLIAAVISNTLAIIKKPSMISGSASIGFREEKERKWLEDIIQWADRKDNFILNQFEAVYDYDRRRVADAIVDKALMKLAEY